MKKSMRFVSETEPLSQPEAEAEGRKFWQRFQEKLRSTICTDPKIRELLIGNGNLKGYLIVGIPLVLVALGAITINPLLLAIIASVFELIMKVGFEVYCESVLTN